MGGLQRFLDAQADIYPEVVAELAAGSKATHWMWFIFPQIAGLGRSETADYFAIRDLVEAQAYLDHPVLGEHLFECVGILNRLGGRTAMQIFGMPDTLKLRSSLTLFEVVAGPDSLFSFALEKYFAGERDGLTLRLLGLK